MGSPKPKATTLGPYLEVHGTDTPTITVLVTPTDKPLKCPNMVISTVF